MSKETRTEIRFFNIMQYEKEQVYLSRMHKSGWKFTGISALCVFHFERCEPEEVVYQLDYNQEGVAHKEEYVRMFEDCGWEYIQDYMGYSYFRKPMSEAGEEEGIFCDDESRLEMMNRVFRGRLTPLIVIFICILLPQFVSNSLNHHPVISVIFAILIILYLGIFAAFASHYLAFRRNVKK